MTFTVPDVLAKTLIASHRQVATIISSWTSCSVLEVSALCGAKCARCADCGVVFKRYIDSEECSEIMALGIVYQGYSDTCLSLLYMNCMHIYIYTYIYNIYISFDCHACSTRLYISVFRLKTQCGFALCPGGFTTKLANFNAEQW